MKFLILTGAPLKIMLQKFSGSFGFPRQRHHINLITMSREKSRNFIPVRKKIKKTAMTCEKYNWITSEETIGGELKFSFFFCSSPVQSKEQQNQNSRRKKAGPH